jgi:hypothetical protein
MTKQGAMQLVAKMQQHKVFLHYGLANIFAAILRRNCSLASISQAPLVLQIRIDSVAESVEFPLV